MSGAFDRVPGIDHDNYLPLPVRERMAENFSDPSTPEGRELSATFVTAVTTSDPYNGQSTTLYLNGVEL